MKKSRYLYISFMLMFFLFVPVTKADVGDLRYQITDIIITDKKITFKGWAFIHQTHNYVNLFKLDNSGKETDIKLVDSNGGQKILIVACDENDNCTEPSPVGGNSDPNYNFTSSLYSYDGGNFYSDYSVGPSYLEGRMGCETNNAGSNCYYRDLGFSITFNLNDLLQIGNDFKFRIAVTNKDFQSKCGNNYSGIKTTKCQWINGEYYTKYNDLSVVNAGVNRIKNNSNDIVEISSSYENNVKFLAETALVKKINEKEEFDGILGPYGEIGSIFKVKKYSSESTAGNRIVNTLGPGKYILYYRYIDKCETGITNIGYNCYFGETENISDSKVIGAWGSWVIPSGQFKIKIKNDKKCDVDTGEPENLSCNGTKKIISECNELTVHDNEKSAVVSIKQTGIIANLLSPTEIYNGGGIKFGILYYNRVEFNYVSGSRDVNIADVINKRISGYENIYLDKIKIGNININSSHMIKKCKQIKNNDEHYTDTICVFYFGPQTVNEDGTIIDGGTDMGINNKYYLPLNYYPVYRVSASLMNASLLDEVKAKDDSKDKNTTWYGSKWNEIELSSDGSCDINVYKLGPGSSGGSNSDYDSDYTTSKIIYSFVYRPIDLNNPFPGAPTNRMIGLNWNSWYSKDSNKDRLKNSYNNLDYSIELDNSTINKIKKYNNSSNYFNFDFDSFISNTGLKIEEGGNS